MVLSSSWATDTRWCLGLCSSCTFTPRFLLFREGMLGSYWRKGANSEYLILQVSTTRARWLCCTVNFLLGHTITPQNRTRSMIRSMVVQRNTEYRSILNTGLSHREVYGREGENGRSHRNFLSIPYLTVSRTRGLICGNLKTVPCRAVNVKVR